MTAAPNYEANLLHTVLKAIDLLLNKKSVNLANKMRGDGEEC
jgi:hypothetical protein